MFGLSLRLDPHVVERAVDEDDREHEEGRGQARASGRRGRRFTRPTAISTASRPKSVVNLMIGFMATELVSLNGSPTVSPTTQASCRSVPFARSSVSTIFFALSQAPPALAMKMA